MKITIGHLYPDLLNLYGDRGNIQCLMKRCLWRGIEAETKLEKRDVILGQYDEDLGEYEIADGLSEKDKIAFPTDELKEGMSVAEGTADQTTAAMCDDSEDDESSDDSAYT